MVRISFINTLSAQAVKHRGIFLKILEDAHVFRRLIPFGTRADAFAC